MSTSGISIRGELRLNEPMSRHTSLKVGGPADIFAVPADLDDLVVLVNSLKERGISYMAKGGGYNLLVRDGGIRGAVILLERLNRIEQLDERRIKAWAGAENLSVVRFAQNLGLGGISFVAGIPGTIGGAVKMNAGAYGSGLLERAVGLTLLRGGQVFEFAISEMAFGYRHLELQPGDIVLAVELALEPCDPAVVEEEVRKDFELRRTKHAVGYPSAGSFFKNPKGEIVWRLIDAAGMRGATFGGAHVSEVHSNFLVNQGGATAADFLALAAQVKAAVQQTCGILIEEEVRIVGEDA